MKTAGKTIGLIVLMVAVMGYTVFNYTAGKIDMSMFLCSMVIIGIPLFNMVNILLREWKNKG